MECPQFTVEQIQQRLLAKGLDGYYYLTRDISNWEIKNKWPSGHDI